MCKEVVFSRVKTVQTRLQLLKKADMSLTYITLANSIKKGEKQHANGKGHTGPVPMVTIFDYLAHLKTEFHLMIIFHLLLGEYLNINFRNTTTTQIIVIIVNYMSSLLCAPP